MFEDIKNFWIRREACRLAALAMQHADYNEAVCPMLWSMTVFFESYLHYGSEGTATDFGPKEPVELEAVRAGST
jgi:hypothetical protein